MIPSLGAAAMDLGLTGMGDQAALQARKDADERRKKINTMDPLGTRMTAVQTLFGQPPPVPPAT